MSDIAIVYGVDTQIGLSIVRELGRQGCKVVAVGKSPQSIGLRSKFVTFSYVLEQKDDEGKLALLRKIHLETGAIHLLCVSEDDIIFFNRVKQQLSPIQPLVPEQALMDKVLDKSFTAKIATEVGIETPKSWLLTSLENFENVKAEIHYPVILKWSNPHQVMKSAAQLKLKIEKIIYCYDSAELQTWVEYYAPLKAWPMIQQYCAGYGLGQFFFMHDNQDLLRFQHKRIHEWPPEGGFSTLCESLPLSHYAELQRKSLELLRKLNWRGVAMVEYRFDPIRKSAVLMEINGRFWGSFPLAFHSNIPFAWYTYKVQGLNQIPQEKYTVIEGLQCRNVLVELKRLHRIFFHSDLIKDKTLTFKLWQEFFMFIWGFVKPSMRYYLFLLKDPKPAFYELSQLFNKAFKKFKQ